MHNEMKVVKEYQYATTQVVGPSRCSWSVSDVLGLWIANGLHCVYICSWAYACWIL